VKNILCFKDCNLIDFFLIDELYKAIRIIQFLNLNLLMNEYCIHR